jgi:hypothetical protein
VRTVQKTKRGGIRRVSVWGFVRERVDVVLLGLVAGVASSLKLASSRLHDEQDEARSDCVQCARATNTVRGVEGVRVYHLQDARGLKGFREDEVQEAAP